MLLKILGAILTIVSCSALGFYFSNEMNVRVKQLRELKKYVTILRGDIRYGGTPLPEAISNLASRSPGAFHAFLHHVSEQLYQSKGGTFSEIWGKSVWSDLKDTSLTGNDKEGLIRFGDTLGYMDREMQVNTIDLYLNQLQEEINDQASVAKERTKLYNVLGIMAGIFITIVMI
ncbi:stage III sporulation protein AB [[Clostridium] polysaccharolyticum]|uniref:Stage III sporulation protein AB n=1 Tax=[Clostridium] polysaccharolyticum TaxID=29364 RepID=A0A1H9ZYW8_9FIRM|nr:stage III sporulation protein AB [[Clostridium] polysaccharolyticum]SES87000.1 stage III sporulation protein AB [[Clostridium] polysaccharolyticum]